MSPSRAYRISKQRFSGWAKRFRDQTATPVVAIGVTHGRDKGKIVICVTEETTNEEAAAFLSYAAMSLLGKTGVPVEEEN